MDINNFLHNKSDLQFCDFFRVYINKFVVG